MKVSNPSDLKDFFGQTSWLSFDKQKKKEEINHLPTILDEED